MESYHTIILYLLFNFSYKYIRLLKNYEVLPFTRKTPTHTSQSTKIISIHAFSLSPSLSPSLSLSSVPLSLFSLFLPWKAQQVSTVDSSLMTQTGTTTSFWEQCCRIACGTHSLASSRHGSATTLVVSFSISSLVSLGASTFTIGNATFMSPKVSFFFSV